MQLVDIAAGLTATGATTVLLDGRSGSGKSTLADELARHWESSTVVRLDDIYPGWDGLAWAIDHVRTSLLQPRAAGRTGSWRRWDWTTATPSGRQSVDAHQRLIVEGVGALSVANRALADLGIWVEVPADVRKRRALDRDGDTYRPHWDRWAAQEEVFIGRLDPRSAADYLVTESAHGLCWTAVGDGPGFAR
ncbi:MAG: hypothetical protein K0R68_432 [Mycobacterium sp.]|jgi:uridine kinase|nr:hypothetical protein [Mycobacterium sp.]